MNLNAKYFLISQRLGRYHQNKFLKTSPKETICTWELRIDLFFDIQTWPQNFWDTSDNLVRPIILFFLHYLILFWFKRYTLVIKILDLINKELCTTVLF